MIMLPQMFLPFGVRTELSHPSPLSDETRLSSKRLAGLIERSHEQTGLPAVVIIDEYDSVLLEYLDKPGQLEEVRRILQEFYQTLKICDAHLQFAFITGITKFSQLSIFSTINNLRNISMKPKYAALCGFTEEELYAVFDPDVAMLAAQYGCSKEEMYAKLKQKYDGYYFTSASQNVYNPFSLDIPRPPMIICT